MKESKYRILWDYGGYEGMKFHEKDFDTVDEAVKEASSQSYSARWLIVRVVEWEANEKKSPFPTPEEMANTPTFKVKRRGKKNKW